MNRETYPSSLFPLRGDISAEAGAVTVEVIGLQNVPLGPLVDGGVPTYDAAGDIINWQASGGGSAILCNGTMVSSDYLILCNTALTINYSSDCFLGVRDNGVLVGD
jgi:hypothetical protein